MNAYQPKTGDRVLVTRTMRDSGTVRWVGVINMPHPDLGFELTGQRLDGEHPTSIVSYFAAQDALKHNGITQTIEPAPTA